MKLLPLLLLLACSAGATPKGPLTLDHGDCCGEHCELDCVKPNHETTEDIVINPLPDPKKHPDEFACAFALLMGVGHGDSPLRIQVDGRIITCAWVPIDAGTP